MFNLRNRSFLKEIDFQPREFRHLLQLSEAVKIAKYAGTETKRLDGKEIALIFEKTSTRSRKDAWSERVGLLKPYQINSTLLEQAGSPRVKFMNCLPALYDPNTLVGREMMEHTGMSTGLEVTGNVFESPASIVFDQAENRLHTIKGTTVVIPSVWAWRWSRRCSCRSTQPPLYLSNERRADRGHGTGSPQP